MTAPAAVPLTAGGAEIVPILDAAYAGSSVNVVANVRQTLFTHGDTQYAGFYDAAGFMVLARRRVPPASAGTPVIIWETLQSEHQGNVADAHNAISLVVDGDGYVHVAWDHHGNPLNYARGKAPGGLELLPPQPMTGQREGQVTYPQFFRTGEGDLYFLYRDGRSGRGALVLNRYETKVRRWTQVQPNLIDGEGVRSPYWGMNVDAQGGLHLAWIWRDSPDVATNHDLCYARSTDGGRTWTTSRGEPLALPITAATAEYAVRIPPRHNLMNSPVVEVDAEGVPHLMSYWSPTPEAAPQFHIVSSRWRSPLHPEPLHVAGSASESTWTVTPIDHPRAPFALAGAGTKRPPMSRGLLLLQGAGAQARAHLVYRDDRRGAKVLAVSSATGLEPPWKLTELTASPVGAWEPSYDPTAWAESGTLRMLLQRVEQGDGNDASAAAVPPEPVGVLSWKPLSP